MCSKPKRSETEFNQHFESDETKKALKDLKEFCKSSQCNLLKCMSRVKYPRR